MYVRRHRHIDTDIDICMHIMPTQMNMKYEQWWRYLLYIHTYVCRHRHIDIDIICMHIMLTQMNMKCELWWRYLHTYVCRHRLLWFANNGTEWIYIFKSCTLACIHIYVRTYVHRKMKNEYSGPSYIQPHSFTTKCVRQTKCCINRLDYVYVRNLVMGICNWGLDKWGIQINQVWLYFEGCGWSMLM